MARRRRSVWPIVVGIGAAAGVIGAIVYSNRAEAKPLPPPRPPMVAEFLAIPVTDPPLVRQYQERLAKALKDPPDRTIATFFPGLTAIDYGASDVDGNPNNPKWVRVISTFQKAANPLLPSFQGEAPLPPGFPAQLRTDGVLDYATLEVMKQL